VLPGLQGIGTGPFTDFVLEGTNLATKILAAFFSPRRLTRHSLLITIKLLIGNPGWKSPVYLCGHSAIGDMAPSVSPSRYDLA